VRRWTGPGSHAANGARNRSSPVAASARFPGCQQRGSQRDLDCVFTRYAELRRPRQGVAQTSRDLSFGKVTEGMNDRRVRDRVKDLGVPVAEDSNTEAAC